MNQLLNTLNIDTTQSGSDKHTELEQTPGYFEQDTTIQLFSVQKLNDFIAGARFSKDNSDADANRAVMNLLRKSGPSRKLMQLPKSFKTNLDELSTQFPNFSEVIDYLRCFAEIAWRTDKILRFTPILLNGPAGIGKTKFAEAIAQWIGLHFHRICISSSQDGSELSGSSAFFSNSKPGVPFLKLANSEFANHLFFLDEIDKNSTKNYDALGGLYTLLEPTSSVHFKDLAYPLELDASHLLWLAASNDIAGIPDAILNRFTVFNVSITKDQSRIITKSIIKQKLAQFNPATLGITFSEEAISALSSAAPRKIAQAVTEAIGQALADSVTTICTVRVAEKANRRIGFLN